MLTPHSQTDLLPGTLEEENWPPDHVQAGFVIYWFKEYFVPRGILSGAGCFYCSLHATFRFQNAILSASVFLNL
jgi:hypothetical protein